MPFENLPPVQRSRRELEAQIDKVVELGTLTKVQGSALKRHFAAQQAIDNFAASQRREGLKDIGNQIEERKVELLQTRLRTRRPLGNTGLLALAVGRRQDKTEPVSRQDLLRHPLVVERARAANVDPNIVLDKFIENDLEWLSLPTAPRQE